MVQIRELHKCLRAGAPKGHGPERALLPLVLEWYGRVNQVRAIEAGASFGRIGWDRLGELGDIADIVDICAPAPVVLRYQSGNQFTNLVMRARDAVHRRAFQIDIVQVHPGVHVSVNSLFSTGREKAIGVVVHVIALPKMLRVAFIGRAGSGEEMAVVVNRLLTNNLLEDIQVIFVFDQTVQDFDSGRELYAAGAAFTGKCILVVLVDTTIGICQNIVKTFPVGEPIHLLECGIHQIGIEDIGYDDISIALILFELLLSQGHWFSLERGSFGLRAAS